MNTKTLLTNKKKERGKDTSRQLLFKRLPCSRVYESAIKENLYQIIPFRGAHGFIESSGTAKTKSWPRVSAERRKNLPQEPESCSPASSRSSPDATRWQPPTTHIFPAPFWVFPQCLGTSRTGGKLRRVSLYSQWPRSTWFSNTLPLVGSW